MIIAVISVVSTRSFQVKIHLINMTDSTIKELTIVSEMSLTIGLFALTVGNFLGGIWANESWVDMELGPEKKLWAFISIIVYAFVLHMRSVPGLRGRYAFHLMTMFQAFCSMVMTYFGVNYYLFRIAFLSRRRPNSCSCLGVYQCWSNDGIRIRCLLQVQKN